jgi:hypothetical protein
MPFCVEFGIAVTKLFSGRFYLDLMVLQTVLLLVYNFILPMEQPFNKKTPLNSDKYLVAQIETRSDSPLLPSGNGPNTPTRTEIIISNSRGYAAGTEQAGIRVWPPAT